MSRRMLALARNFAVAVSAIWLVSCESAHSSSTSTEPPVQPAGYGKTEVFTPIVTGEADFIELSAQEHAIRFFLRGSYSSQSAGEVKLLSIDVYGAPGRPTKGKKLTFLGNVAKFESADGSWKVEPQDLGDNKKLLKFKTADLGKKLRDYTIRLEFNYSDGGTGKKGTEPRSWWISTLADPTPAIVLPQAETDGDTITSLGGSGTFYGAQRIAIYDVHVEFNQPVKKVEVFAGAAPDPTTKIYEESFQTPLDDAFDYVGLVGRYNGTANKYYLKVIATDTNNTPDPEEKTFTNILDNLGVTIPMSSWTPLE